MNETITKPASPSAMLRRLLGNHPFCFQVKPSGDWTKYSILCKLHKVSPTNTNDNAKEPEERTERWTKVNLVKTTITSMEETSHNC